MAQSDVFTAEVAAGSLEAWLIVQQLPADFP
jgi:hypothetical protein